MPIDALGKTIHVDSPVAIIYPDFGSTFQLTIADNP